MINELTNSNQNSTRVTEIKINDAVVDTPSDIADALNKHFSSVGSSLASGIQASDIEPESYLIPTDNAFCLQSVSVNKVCKLLKNLDSKKATGLDNIPCKLLKLAADIVSPSLTHIFNCSIKTGIFPSNWKLAKVTHFFFKGAKLDANNYRPISVIPAVAKIFEKAIHDQLYEYLNTNNLLSNCQSGFRSMHSTLTALLEATNSWSVNIDKGLLNAVVFIDLKKAFDTIDHLILLRKLRLYGFDEGSLRWFESYLSNRSQRCSVNGHLSKTCQITCGVPQGSILGPLLFLLYINDLPNCLCKARPRMYADDTSISLASSCPNVLENEMSNDGTDKP